MTGAALARGLHWMARHAEWLLAAGVFAGVALPGLAAAAKPLLAPLVFLLLVLALLRLDFTLLGAALRRPWVMLLALAIMMLATPVAVWQLTDWLDLSPGLARSLVLMAATAPLMSTPAMASMLGLDAVRATAVMVVGNLAMPLILPPLVGALAGLEIDLGVAGLMGRLLAMIAGAFVAAAGLRKIIGSERRAAWAITLDGASVAVLLVFALAVMDGVAGALADRPGTVALYALAACLANAGLQGMTAAIFWAAGRRVSLTLAYAAGNRNTAVLLAAMGSGASPDFALYVAVHQLPIYLFPLLLRPLFRFLLPNQAAARATDPPA